MLEKRIEAAFVSATQKRGGLCLKFTSPSMAEYQTGLCFFLAATLALLK